MQANAQSLVGICFIASGVVLTTLAVPESSAAYTAHELLSSDTYASPRAFWYIIALLLTVMLIAGKLEHRHQLTGRPRLAGRAGPPEATKGVWELRVS